MSEQECRRYCCECWHFRRYATYDRETGEYDGVEYECPHDDAPAPDDDANACPHFEDSSSR